MIPANPLVQIKGGAGAGGGIGGSTGSADNALLRADGTGGSSMQASGILVDDSNAMSGQLSGRKAGSGGLTLAAADSGKTVSITAGGGDDSVTLPAAPTLGTWYRFVILGTDELTIQAQGSHVIYVGSAASTAAGVATSSTKGSMLHLEYVATNMWAGLDSGTWAVA